MPEFESCQKSAHLSDLIQVRWGETSAMHVLYTIGQISYSDLKCDIAMPIMS
jgi:hypothetical protein